MPSLNSAPENALRGQTVSQGKNEDVKRSLRLKDDVYEAWSF